MTTSNGHGEGPAHPGLVTLLGPENTSVLSVPTLLANVVDISGLPLSVLG